MSEPNAHYMMQALESARKGIHAQEGGPFGCCIADPVTGEIVSCAHNEVLKRGDATAHAEVLAIQEASRARKTWDLSGLWLYATTECCPMCFSAAHWARISVIVYGTRIDDVAALGFHELPVSNSYLNKQAGSLIALYPDVCREECLSLLHEWSVLSHKQTY